MTSDPIVRRLLNLADRPDDFWPLDADEARATAARITELEAESSTWHKALIRSEEARHELERAVRMFLTEIDESHQPMWVSEEAKAAGKEPWVCVTCGTADGSWPCGERLSLDELKAALGEVRDDQ
jgi:Ni,Fe-hydrogenase III component G